MNDDPLDLILGKARQAPHAPIPGGLDHPPPGMARSVVRRWLSSSVGEASASWMVVSRRGLAVALGLMAASMLWHAREWRTPVLMESSASETVILSVYPQ